jgi:hypothetical protein
LTCDPALSRNPNPAVANFRDFKSWSKIVAAVTCILARQRFVSPVTVFLGMNLRPAADLDRWKRGHASLAHARGCASS